LTTALAAIADSLGLALSVDESARLLEYVALLHRWNATYNLTAVRDPVDMLTQHLADCLALIPPLRRHLNRRDARFLDVGSGGGLPGVIVAIMLPNADVTCVDAVGKKAAFLRQAAGALRLPNLHAAHARVEQLKAPPFDVVTARAFASLADLTILTRAQLRSSGIWVAMKGRTPNDEIARLGPDVEVFHVEPLVVPGLDAPRCLVWMRPHGIAR
jgi:16S rRNA (guanine527-N7)-methyltransferase